MSYNANRLSYPTSLTFLECVDLTWKLLTALAIALRQLASSLTMRQIQSSTTAAAYESFAASRGVEPRTALWGETGKGHWVGSHHAANVLVWFHGGNYYAPAHPAYFEFLHNIVDALRLLGKDFAIFVPSYSLAPHAQYPIQLLEGLEVLRFLIEEESKVARNIVIGGDSAGGNLVLGILSHIAHPHPEISAGFVPDEPFAGALMLCPWVTFDQTWPSIERNKDKDCVPLLPNSTHARHFLGDMPSDNYNEPLSAPLEWWTDLNARRLLLLSGEDDIMVDSHHAFARILAAANPYNTETVTVVGEGHVAPVLDLMLGDRKEFESSKVIQRWLSSCL
ncbi:hypothetical protein MW887_001072 [Aspergillus wentii]|nr:hypothetical protein MW887_001072 [Aspergillus wentii]